MLPNPDSPTSSDHVRDAAVASRPASSRRDEARHGVDDEAFDEAAIDAATADAAGAGESGTGEPGPAASPATVMLAVPARAAGMRVDRFLADSLDDVSRTRLQKWIGMGAVQVDGMLRLPKHRLTGFETIRVEPQPMESEHAWRPEAIDLPVLHVDRDLVVVNKPAGLVTHPAPGHWSGTLLNALLHHHPGTAALPRAGIVHRLDRDTTGAMVCALSERAFASLSSQLAERSMRRVYLAIVHGVVPESGTFDGAIGRDPHQRLRMAVVDAQAGRAARTDYVCVQATDRHSLVLCRLHSGRTHQIRVHFSHARHALVGDTTYGGIASGTFGRQALHSVILGLSHPADGQWHRHEAPVPPDLRELAITLGFDIDAAVVRARAWTAS